MTSSNPIGARRKEEPVTIPQLLTVDEVATILRVKPGAIYMQRHRGEAPGSLGIRIGRRILFRPGDLDQFLTSESAVQQRAVPVR